MNSLGDLKELYIDPMNEFLWNHLYIFGFIVVVVLFIILLNRLKEFIISRKKRYSDALFTMTWVSGEFYDTLSKHKTKT